MGTDNSEKSTPKKGASEKKASTAKKGSPTKKVSASSKTPSKTAQTPKAKAAKPKTSPKKSKAPARKKKMTAKELLLKKFDTWTPDALFRPEPAPQSPKDHTAPPFVTEGDEAEVTRIRKLLFKKFDLSEPETATADPKAESHVDSAPPPPVSPSAMPKRSDPMGTTIKFVLLGFALLVALILKVSVTNRSNYYIIPTKAGVEIWQGIFAPMGKERLIRLDNADVPESVQTVYGKQQVYQFAFGYYIKNADALLEKPGMPDFEGIKSYLNQARPYAVTEKHRRLVTARLNSIDQMIFLIKADVAASKETIPDYEAALEYLKQAQILDVDGSKSELIKEKVAAVESAKAALGKEKEQEQKPAGEAAAPAK